MRFVCASDTHMMRDRVPIPDGDVLIHAGDFTMRGELKDERTSFINASMCDGTYNPINPPIVFDYSVKACARP